MVKRIDGSEEEREISRIERSNFWKRCLFYTIRTAAVVATFQISNYAFDSDDMKCCREDEMKVGFGSSWAARGMSFQVCFYKESHQDDQDQRHKILTYLTGV
jgi:hypothetical protein